MTGSDFPEFTAIAEAIGKALGRPCAIRSVQAVGGGCINSGFRLLGASGDDYFVKINRREWAWMFEAEAAGLVELATTGTVRVPKPVAHGIAGGKAFLAMEWLDLGGGRGRVQENLGRRLAALHRIPQPYFGWPRDNTIGSTPQINDRSGDWVAFWSERRLGYQLELAARQGNGGRLQRDGEKLCSRLAGFFSGYRPSPSLLHGDLWSGNFGGDAQGEPVIFDPACYYGDREADLAMTELFGGFDGGFHGSYREAWPLDAGYSVRKQLYNLYHILNHLNLFGGGYLGQAQGMLSGLLAHLEG